MAALLTRAWKSLLGILDNALPLPPDQAAERDWTGESSADQSNRLRLRMRLQMLGKRSKGGFR